MQLIKYLQWKLLKVYKYVQYLKIKMVYLKSTSFAKLLTGFNADFALRVSGFGGTSAANNSWVT